MNYRKDINGLRALAVIAVVIFHFNSNWLPGGFAGVDVFFVISGFLMTRIIFNGLDDNSFSLLRFYIARANRIIPALTVLCLVLLIFGWFYLLPGEYKELGKHAATSLSFLSNIIYWQEFGYFDEAAHGKWLLHTWSLSVEWQFYIIYPILLILLKRIISLQTMKYMIIAGALFSFILCVIYTYEDPSYSFYLLPTRAWEMMVGGVAFLFPFNLKHRNKVLFEVSGYVLIISTYIFISENNFWPGILSVVPVLGTYFIIQAQRNDSFLANNIFLQKIGTYSYSIYLWHWPLVVFGIYFELGEYWIYLGLLISVGLGWISSKYIEGIRFVPPTINFVSLIFYKPFLMIVLVGGVSSIIYITKGVESHYPNNVVLAAKEASNRNPYKCMVGDNQKAIITPCVIGNPNNIKAIVVGDSHADALTTSVANSFELNNEGIIAMTRSACPFVFNAKNRFDTNNNCLNSIPLVMEYIKDNYKGIPVFVINRMPLYLYGQSNPFRVLNNDNSPWIYFSSQYDLFNEKLLNELHKEFEATMCNLRETNPIFITQPIPEMEFNVPQVISKKLLRGENIDKVELSIKEYFNRNGAVRKMTENVAKQCKATILDPAEILCKNMRCIAHQKGRPLYYDGDHMSEFGNRLLIPMFKKALGFYNNNWTVK